MTNKKLSYWELRAIQEEEQVKQDSIKVEATVRKAYLKAQTYLTGEVKKIYQRYLNKTDKTEAEVKQILNTSVDPSELVRLKQLTKDITNPQLKTESQNYLTGLAVKHRITRLEDLKAKSYLVSKQVANVQLDKQTDFYVETIHDAYNKAAAESIIGHAESGIRATNDGKYKSWAVKDGKLVHELIDSESGKVLDTIKVTKNEPVTEFKELSTKYVRNILDNHWQGSNYSKRIWNDTELLAKRLEELFTVEAMTGMSEQEMIKAISKEFETSINVSRRLIRTEANYMANQAKLRSWQEHGVKEYVIVATLDFRTSETCQHQDGKRYKVADAVVSVNFPPFHPWCRTVVRAIFSEMSLSGNRTAIDRVTGKTMTIKQAATYKEWEKMLIDKHGEKDLELVKTKVKNYRSDLAQFNKYKSIIGADNIPKLFDKFQEMKYNEGSEWEQLKDNYFVKSRLKDGRYGSIINPDKQAPHMKSTVAKGKSYFDDNVDVQELFDKYAGTGKIDRDFSGKRKNTEVITVDDFKGTAVSLNGTQETSTFKIHHAKKRTHIVPIKRKGDT
ncbi:minor capsid protein [Vagococcus fluvialis]|uniref:minor capsid protein n=1 Tax=Vagococcus fluvialis TaxID=2738 RepID=UPI0020335B36|nr:minor capsid protein [Vagococcus fluvialis]MCM2138909.1 minor capsid protein [Vagococcus fluvialis]